MSGRKNSLFVGFNFSNRLQNKYWRFGFEQKLTLNKAKHIVQA